MSLRHSPFLSLALLVQSARTFGLNALGSLRNAGLPAIATPLGVNQRIVNRLNRRKSNNTFNGGVPRRAFKYVRNGQRALALSKAALRDGRLIKFAPQVRVAGKA